MAQQIDQQTLANIGGGTTAKAANGFAQTMLQLYTTRKNAELQDLQKAQMQNQLNEDNANKGVRDKERFLIEQRQQMEIDNLPQEQRTKIIEMDANEQQAENKLTTNLVEGFAKIASQKQKRSYFEKNKDKLIKNVYGSEEAWKAEFEQPWTQADHQLDVEAFQSRTIKEASARLAWKRQLELARVKAAGEAKTTKAKHIFSPVGTLKDALKESDWGFNDSQAFEGAQVIQSLTALSQDNKLPFKMSEADATLLTKKLYKEAVQVADARPGWLNNVEDGDIIAQRDKWLKNVETYGNDYAYASTTGVAMDTIEAVRKKYPTATDEQIYYSLDQMRERKGGK